MYKYYYNLSISPKLFTLTFYIIIAIQVMLPKTFDDDMEGDIKSYIPTKVIMQS